ncbi:MAG: hypothetical protein GY863_03060 [bacterium]|nr:hypothetical protein [bacterium]
MIITAAGMTAVTIIVLLPVDLQNSTDKNILLSGFMPDYHVIEKHSIRVNSPVDSTYLAIKNVTIEEIRFFQVLSWIRMLPNRLFGDENAQLDINPDSLEIDQELTFLDILQIGPFFLQAEEENREIVLGLVVPTLINELRGGKKFIKFNDKELFLSFQEKGYFKSSINFVVRDMGEGWTEVTTETRCLIPDPATRREFMIYWRTIAPWSGLIRKMWLSAIKDRAEGNFH